MICSLCNKIAVNYTPLAICDNCGKDNKSIPKTLLEGLNTNAQIIYKLQDKLHRRNILLNAKKREVEELKKEKIEPQQRIKELEYVIKEHKEIVTHLCKTYNVDGYYRFRND